MNLVFLINNSYAEQLAVTIMSILNNTKKKTVYNIYIINTDLSENNKEKLKNLKSPIKYNIKFITANEEEFNNLPKVLHLKTMNYIRLQFPTLLKNCDKALYLDADIIVMKDITEFYNTKFDNNYAVVIGERLANSFQIEKQMKKFNINNYFNAGVMLLNLEKIREDNIQQKCFEIIQKQINEIMFLEQCVLNKVFANNVKFVDKTYNFQYKLKKSEEIYKKFTKHNGIPHIIHFVGKEKPFEGYAHPFEGLYYNILKKTPFKTSYIVFKYKMWKKLLEKVIRKIIIIFGCMI